MASAKSRTSHKVGGLTAFGSVTLPWNFARISGDNEEVLESPPTMSGRDDNNE